jgi:iron complex outermembrane receptor protein
MTKSIIRSLRYGPNKIAYLCVIAGLIAAPMTPLKAQETGASVLEEIVVTARRYAESLQDTPVSVSVMDSEYLDAQNIDQLKDIIDKSPGTSFTKLNKLQNAYSMRGLSSQTEGAAGDSSVITVVDDVVVTKDYMKGAEFFDVERVEVLRGPQGTSFGRNTTGGLVHLISKRPTQEFEASIRGGFGSHDHWELDSLVSGAISDNAAARLAVHYNSHDGYTKDVLRNVDLGAEENISVRGSLLFNPSDNVEIYLKAEYSQDDDDAAVRQPRNCTDPQEEFTNFIDPCDEWETAISSFAGSNDLTGTVFNPGEEIFIERESFNFTAEISWQMNDSVTLTSVTGFIDGTGDYNMDAAGTPRDLQFSVTRNDSSQFSEEIRLDNHAAEDGLRWLAGLYFLSDDHDREDGRRWFQEDFSVYGPGPPFSPTLVNAVSTNETESLGLFGEVSFDITDQLTATAGLRYSSDEKDFVISHNGTGFDGPVSNFLADVPSNWPDPNDPATSCAAQAMSPESRCSIGFSNATANGDWDHVSYKVSLAYAVNDDVMVYGTVSDAYKTGGFNGEPQTPEDAVIPYNEETAMNYEIGLKSQWADRLRLNIAAFYVEYDDQQVNVFRAGATGFATQVVDNAAESEVLGLEVDYTWQVNDYFRLSGTFATLDAELKNTVLQVGPAPTDTADLSGNRPNNAPEWTATLVGEIEFPLAGGSRISLRADWRGRSSIFNDLSNNSSFERPGTDIIGARAGWISSDGAWEVTVYGKNLTEEADVLNIGPAPPFLGDNPTGFGPPLTYGATVSYRVN